MFTPAVDQQNHSAVPGKLTCGLIFSILTVLSTSAVCALAQGVAATPPLVPAPVKLSNSGVVAKNTSALKVSSKPAWQELTPSQQASLKPLAANWNTLSEFRKRKWIAIAASYPNLAPTEQAKLHSRMTEWASLSQQQRNQARLNFAQTKQLTPTEKTSTWQAYQALSPEEKKKLASSASHKPVGATAAAKPVPVQKLAIVPVTRQTPKKASSTAAANYAVNRNTLLPQTPGEPSPTQKR